MPSQELLRAELGARIDRARRHVPPAAAGPRTGAIAVLRDFAPATFVASAAAFARRTPEDRRAAWYRAFTRTVFLAGDPRNLLARHPCDHLAPDGSVAWYGPGPLDRHEGLLRALRPFRGPSPVHAPAAMRVAIPCGTGRAARLEVPAADLSVEEYLINVNHLVAEAVLDGLLAGAGSVLVRHPPRDPPPSARWDRIRVAPDPRHPDRLRAYAYLAV